MNQAARKTFFRNWYRTEIIPIWVTMGVAVAGVSWYSWRLAMGPGVVWANKTNPYPWQHIDQDTNIKMMAVSKEFKKSYVREKW
jgi:NADH dehydrogenase (ubiquinone) 1 alpha subcomplex subunit 4